MTPATKKDDALLSEAYTKINEGLWDRTAATMAGAGQYVKNVGTALKGGVSTTSPQQAQLQSILKRSAGDFLTNIYKMKLVPGAETVKPSDQEISQVVGALQPILTQLQQNYAKQSQAAQAVQQTQQAGRAQQAAGTVSGVPPTKPAGTP